MAISRFCPNCGFIFWGQRTSNCPSCDAGTSINEGRTYRLNPKELRKFDELDRKGGMLEYLAQTPKNRNVECLEVHPKGNWVTLRVLHLVITFADYGHGPQIIAKINPGAQIYDPFSNQVPQNVMRDAIATAAAIMKEKKRRHAA